MLTSIRQAVSPVCVCVCGNRKQLQFEAESTCTIFSIIIFQNEEPKHTSSGRNFVYACSPFCFSLLILQCGLQVYHKSFQQQQLPPKKTTATPEAGCYFGAAESAERGEENVNVGLF